MHYGRELAERGYVVLAPDYPSLGEHTYDFTRHSEYASGTMKAIWDNVRAVDLLAALPEVDPERIGVIGHSLGGHNALFTAAFEPRLKVVVTSCGFTSLKKDDLPSWSGPRYMPRIDSEFGNDIRQLPFDFPEILAAIAPRPLLACAATRDDDFDVSGVRDCIAAVQPIYRLLGAGDQLQAEYPESPHDFPSEARERAYAFLDRHLRDGNGKNGN
jgi:dienelactone hydrolase